MKIYQIELSNYCNLTCRYCPHPNQKRQKGFMELSTFKKVVALAKKCGQSMLYLHNFGEVVLHPNLAEFIAYAKEEGIECSFFTNGVLFTEELIKILYSAGLRKISISNHVSNADVLVKELIEKANVPIIIDEVYDVSVRHNWAGQILETECDYVCQSNDEPCIFERKNAFVVLWNGDIASCCIDCDGVSIHYTVDDLLINDYTFVKSRLCNSCDLMRGDEEL